MKKTLIRSAVKVVVSLFLFLTIRGLWLSLGWNDNILLLIIVVAVGAVGSD
jgi:hypothetical protein